MYPKDKYLSRDDWDSITEKLSKKNTEIQESANVLSKRRGSWVVTDANGAAQQRRQAAKTAATDERVVG